MPKLRINIKIFELLLILLIGLTPLLWFGPSDYAGGHDMSYPFAPIEYFKDRLYTWTDRTNAFGINQTDDLPGFFIHGLQALFPALGLSIYTSQKIVFVFWFILPGLTMYALLNHLHPKKEEAAIRLIGSIFFMLNHYLLQAWHIAEMTKFGIYSSIPILTLATYKALFENKSKLKYAAIGALILFFLNGGSGLPLYAGPALVLVSISVIYYLSSSHKTYALRNIFMFFGAFVLLLLLLNTYWIVPFLQSFQSNYIYKVETAGGVGWNISWSQQISRFASYSNLFRLQGIPSWYSNPKHSYALTYLKNPIFIGLSMIIPLVAVLGTYIRKPDTKKIASIKKILLLTVLVSIPLTAGSHPPLGFLYNIALEKLPFFNIFRTPFYKFGMALWFAYAYLFALGTCSILRITSKRTSGYIKTISLLLVIIFLFIYNYPYYLSDIFTGHYNGFKYEYKTMLQTPQYVFDFKKELNDVEYFDKVIQIPNTDPRVGYFDYDWKYFSHASVTSLLGSKAVFVRNDKPTPNEKDYILSTYEQLLSSNNPSLARIASINKAVVQQDFDSENHINYDPKEQIDNFTALNYPLIDNHGKWKVYDLSSIDPSPLVYSPNNTLYIETEISQLDQILSYPLLTSFDSIYTPKNTSNDLRKMFNSYLLQAACQNCEVELTTSALNVTAYKVNPKSKIFPLYKKLIDYQESKLNKPDELINFYLKQIGSYTGSLSKTYGDVNSLTVIQDIGLSIVNYIQKIETQYNKIDDRKTRINVAHNIQKSTRYFPNNIKSWANSTPKSKKTDALMSIVDSLVSLEQRLGLEGLLSIYDSTPETREFTTDIPGKGYYSVGIMLPPKDWFSENDIYFQIGKNTVLGKSKDGWLVSSPVEISEGIINISTPNTNNLTKRRLVASGLNIQDGSCEYIELLESMNFQYGIVYRIRIEDENLIPNSVKFFINESNQDYDLTKQTPIALRQNENNSYLNYQPSKLASAAVLQICSINKSGESLSINSISIKPHVINPLVVVYSNNQKPELPHQPLDFLALNQTAYLVRVKNINPEYILNLNVRSDGNWKISKVDQETADNIFSANPDHKKHAFYNTNEYSRLNKHIITDLLFTKKEATDYNKIEFNGFGSNAWIINSNKDTTSYYLIEHNLQPSLYRYALITLVTLSVTILIILKKR